MSSFFGFGGQSSTRNHVTPVKVVENGVFTKIPDKQTTVISPVNYGLLKNSNSNVSVVSINTPKITGTGAIVSREFSRSTTVPLAETTNSNYDDDIFGPGVEVPKLSYESIQAIEEDASERALDHIKSYSHYVKELEILKEIPDKLVSYQLVPFAKLAGSEAITLSPVALCWPNKDTTRKWIRTLLRENLVLTKYKDLCKAMPQLMSSFDTISCKAFRSANVVNLNDVHDSYCDEMADYMMKSYIDRGNKSDLSRVRVFGQGLLAENEKIFRDLLKYRGALFTQLKEVYDLACARCEHGFQCNETGVEASKVRNTYWDSVLSASTSPAATQLYANRMVISDSSPSNPIPLTTPIPSKPEISNTVPFYNSWTFEKDEVEVQKHVDSVDKTSSAAAISTEREANERKDKKSKPPKKPTKKGESEKALSEVSANHQSVSTPLSAVEPVTVPHSDSIPLDINTSTPTDATPTQPQEALTEWTDMQSMISLLGDRFDSRLSFTSQHINNLKEHETLFNRVKTTATPPAVKGGGGGRRSSLSQLLIDQEKNRAAKANGRASVVSVPKQERVNDGSTQRRQSCISKTGSPMKDPIKKPKLSQKLLKKIDVSFASDRWKKVFMSKGQ